MQKRAIFAASQTVEPEDLERVGTFPRESFDNAHADLSAHPAPRFTGFAIEVSGPAEVRVAAGRFHRSDGAVYAFESASGQVIDLLANLPAVANRIATIVAFPQDQDTETAPRTFLVDADTGETEGRQVSTVSARIANVDAVFGQEAPTPQAPAINSNFVAIANVLLTPTGVESVTILVENQLTSLRDLDEHVSDLGARLQKSGSQIDTLKTDMSAVSAEVARKANANFVHERAVDMANVKEEIGLPDDYTAWGADRYLDETESDPGFAGYSAQVQEGVSFPAIATATSAFALANPIDTRVTQSDNLIFPTFTSTPRLSVRGRDGEYALANTSTENVQTVRQTVSRTRRVLQNSRLVCTNSAWWRSGRYDPVTGLFTRNGEVFEVENIGSVIRQNGLTYAVRVGHYVEETYQEVYWERLVDREDVTGSIVGQTFLNSQDGWLTGLNLFFTKKASAGDVRVLLVETLNGEPALDRVLAKTVLTPTEINVGDAATPVSFVPTFLTKGKRYAIVLISTGAHFVATVSDNKFAQGTIFYSTDGAFVQADLFVDLAFEALFAEFASPIVTVDLAPLELAGGIATIDINSDVAIPEGTQLEFQVRVDNVWRTLGPDDQTALATQPAVLQMRARFIGTTDVMPALGIGALRSAVTVSRAGSAFTHVSAVRTMPTAVDTIELRTLLENWDGAAHTATLSLLTGATFGTVETPDAVVDLPAPGNPDAIMRIATFQLAAPVTEYRIQIDGATTSAARHFHVAERTDIAFTS